MYGQTYESERATKVTSADVYEYLRDASLRILVELSSSSEVNTSLQKRHQRRPHVIAQLRLRARHGMQVVGLERVAVGRDRFEQEWQQRHAVPCRMRMPIGALGITATRTIERQRGDVARPLPRLQPPRNATHLIGLASSVEELEVVAG